VRVVVEGFDLPGRRFCDPDGNPLDDVRVGVQGWELDVAHLVSGRPAS
jgi:hypothetical protein